MEHYLQKTFYKTASLIANSCKAIAILSGQSREVVELAWDYGKNLGLAFQVCPCCADVASCLPLLPSMYFLVLPFTRFAGSSVHVLSSVLFAVFLIHVLPSMLLVGSSILVLPSMLSAGSSIHVLPTTSIHAAPALPSMCTPTILRTQAGANAHVAIPHPCHCAARVLPSHLM